jgi:hypothetical protein
MNCRFIQPTPQPAHIGGGREIWELIGNGPTSYSQATGDLISGPGNGEYFSVPFGGFLTPDGLYELKPFSTSPGTTGSLRLKWGFRWYFANGGGDSGVASVAQNAAGTGMTPGTYPIAFSGGTGSGAAGTVTVSATAVTATTITSPGIYTVAPTAAIGGTPGGSPATLTVTMSVAGAEVPTGLNLSAEYVQFGAIGGQM